MAAGMAGGSVVIRFATRAGIVIQVWDWSSSNNIILTERSHLGKGLESGFKTGEG